MTARQLQILAAISAANARIAGMQAANQHRLSCGDSIMYNEDHFAVEAHHLELFAIGAANS